MKFTTERPPIYDEANKLFGLEEHGYKAVFTYGDTCYNPSGCEIDSFLIRHEETHMEQQDANGDVAAMWWKRYIQDPEFRVDQEAEAYGAQYKLYTQQERRRDMRAQYLWGLAKMLSGPMYGKAISHSEAMKAIRMYAEHPLG